MLKHAYLLAKIGADTAETEREFPRELPNIRQLYPPHAHCTGDAVANAGRVGREPKSKKKKKSHEVTFRSIHARKLCSKTCVACVSFAAFATLAAFAASSEVEARTTSSSRRCQPRLPAGTSVYRSPRLSGSSFLDDQHS